MENKETNASNLTRGLRVAGVIAVVTAAIIFMLQGLSALSSYERYLSFASLTAALAGLGLFAGGRMKEAKSARTFLALAAAATPVLFSQLGAMLYGQVNVGSAASVPSAFIMEAPSFAMLAIAGVATAVLIAPVLYVGFGAFFRERAKEMVMLLLAGSVLLLIPVRDQSMTAALIALQALGLAGYAYRVRQVKSVNAAAPIILLALAPVAIMIGRGLFYRPSELFFAATSLFFSAIAFQIVPAAQPKLDSARSLRGLGLVSGALSWVFAAGAFAQTFLVVSDRFALMLMFYPAAVAVIALEARARRSTSLLSGLATCLLLAVPLMTIVGSWTLGMALLLFFSGLLTSVVGYTLREKKLFVGGMLPTVMGFGYLADTSFDIFRTAPWVSLAVAGIAFILLAAWLEKNRSQLVRLKMAFSTRFDSERPTIDRA